MIMSMFWLVALVVFGLVEALTVGLTSIWFALGALTALLAAVLGASALVQIILFLAVSFLSLLLMRPLSQRMLNWRVVATNADRILGTDALVTEEIDNFKGQGHVAVGGVPWTARSEDDVPIPLGARVRILRIEGVKVFVTPVDDESAEP